MVTYKKKTEKAWIGIMLNQIQGLAQGGTCSIGEWFPSCKHLFSEVFVPCSDDDDDDETSISLFLQWPHGGPHSPSLPPHFVLRTSLRGKSGWRIVLLAHGHPGSFINGNLKLGILVLHPMLYYTTLYRFLVLFSTAGIFLKVSMILLHFTIGILLWSTHATC